MGHNAAFQLLNTFRHPTVNRGRFNIKYLYSPCWPFSSLLSGCVLLANKVMVSPLLLPHFEYQVVK